MAWNMGLLGATAGGLVSAEDFLEEVVLTSDASSVTFDNLDSYSGYKHLQLRTVVAEDNGTTNMRPIFLEINGDFSISSYITHNVRSNYLSGTVRSGSRTGEAAFRIDNMAAPDTATNSFAGCVIDILDFASTSKNKTIKAFGGGLGPDGGEYSISLRSGLWLNTSAITSMRVYANTNNFITGSRFSLYGAK